MKKNESYLEHLKSRKPQDPGDAYFDALAAAIQDKIRQEETLLNHLKPIKKQEPDDAYFEELNARILTEIKQNKGRRTPIILLRPRFWLSAVAASILIFFSLKFFNDEEKPGFHHLSEGEILAYVENNIDDFDEELFAEHLNGDTTKNTTLPLDPITKKPKKVNSPEKVEIPKQSAAEILETITPEDIQNYLRNEGLEEEDLEEEIL